MYILNGKKRGSILVFTGGHNWATIIDMSFRWSSMFPSSIASLLGPFSYTFTRLGMSVSGFTYRAWRIFTFRFILSNSRQLICDWLQNDSHYDKTAPFQIWCYCHFVKVIYTLQNRDWHFWRELNILHKSLTMIEERWLSVWATQQPTNLGLPQESLLCYQNLYDLIKD